AGVAGVLFLSGLGLYGSLSLNGEAGPGWWTALVERERIEFKAVEGTPAPAASLPTAAHSLLWSSVCAALIAVGLTLRRGAASAATLGLLVVGELWSFGSRYFAGHPTAEMEWPPEFVHLVKNHPRFPFRIATVTMAQTPAIGKCQIAGLDHIGGFDPMMLRRYAE